MILLIDQAFNLRPISTRLRIFTHRQLTFPAIEPGTHFALFPVAVGKPLEIAKYFPILTE
jgi:hypothetical protein